MDRRSKQDRREVNVRVFPGVSERRKNPDRRQAGLDVKELYVSEEAFSKIFDKFIPNIHKMFYKLNFLNVR